jgi:mannobiose 2-epimerase
MTNASTPELQGTFKQELDQILEFWLSKSHDYANGGFFGDLDNYGSPVQGTVKGSVLNARILWSFSAAYKIKPDNRYIAMARRAYAYIVGYFVDPVHGGVYWSVTPKGKPADEKKQIYALAFTIYGLAAYYEATQEEEALMLAQDLFYTIEKHSFDQSKGGYLEAFTRDWKLIDDLRLSDKDANEKKTMNTHLHILEAYTTLYKVWPNAQLRQQLIGLIQNFEDYILNPETAHLNLFLDEDWSVKSDTISYGHDIEASWLLVEAAEALHDEELLNRVKILSVDVARASAEGLNTDGSMNYEYEPSQQHLIGERHWWVQGEAVVGFYNAYQISKEQHFYDKAVSVWNYTVENIIDHENGEWFWGRHDDGSLIAGYGKGGFWKCPYHNSRACIEMLSRLA